MATTAPRVVERPIHPLHAFFLAASFPLFFGALLADWAYSGTYEIQWKNFASWLLVGALVFAGTALIGALVHLIRSRWRGRALLYFLLLLSAWILGLLNALVHAKDAWASMPEALILSILATLLILGAVLFGLSGRRREGEVR